VVKDVRARNSVKVSKIYFSIFLYPFSFHSEGEIVRWSIDGSKFIVQSGSTIDLYSTVAFFSVNIYYASSFSNIFAQNMDLLFSIKHPSRVHDVKFCQCVNGEGEVILAGAEDHKTTVYSIPTDATNPIIIAEMIGHSNRSVFS
jgi:protein MAK11